MRITEMRTQESHPRKDDKRNDYHRSTNKELVYVVKIFHVSIPHIQECFGSGEEIPAVCKKKGKSLIRVFLSNKIWRRG